MNSRANGHFGPESALGRSPFRRSLRLYDAHLFVQTPGPVLEPDLLIELCETYQLTRLPGLEFVGDLQILLRVLPPARLLG